MEAPSQHSFAKLFVGFLCFHVPPPTTITAFVSERLFDFESFYIKSDLNGVYILVEVSFYITESMLF